MKKTFIISGIVLFLLAILVFSSMLCVTKSTLASQNLASDESFFADEHPTKEEWLEVYITHKIKQYTDLYAQRIAVQVAIVSKAKEVVITLTSAYEPEELSKTVKKIYCDEVEKIVKDILENYEWARNYNLTIQFI